jgi:hypothetical protein
MQITEKDDTFPYKFLSMPLSTAEERKRVITYMLMFRSMNDPKFMQKYGLEKGFGVRRAMIFDRPPVLTRLFQDLGLAIPAPFRDGLGRASRIHKENTAPVPVAPSSLIGASPALALPTASTTPPLIQEDRIALARQALREGKNIVGGYGKPINPFGLTKEEQDNLIKESKESTTPQGSPGRPGSPGTPAGTPPNSPPYRPSTPLRGGTRRKRTNGTRRVVKTVEHFAKAFSKVWAKHGKV